MKILTGKEIRIKRIINDINMTEFADKMSVSTTWMSLVETGKEKGIPLRMKATMFFNEIEQNKTSPSNIEDDAA